MQDYGFENGPDIDRIVAEIDQFDDFTEGPDLVSADEINRKFGSLTTAFD